MVDLLDELHAVYLLALLNNEGKEWGQCSRQTYDFYNLFHVTLGSYEAGVAKPSREIFHMLGDRLKHHKIALSECLFIDDNEQNVAAAKDAGMSAIVFLDPKQLREILQQKRIAV